MFQNIILISPSLWWNKSELLSAKFMENLKQIKSYKNIFIGVGGSESKMLVNAILDFQERIEAMNNRIDINQTTYDGEDHQSLLPQAIYDGIDLFYGKGLK